ncbi:unnamed protein product [Arabis nemorensis]|uniref:Uncharacterized protein n=1 Tax=Arabis nemorensis TaxID=586526 RepID=A0A565AMW9_9BRAS|nr:unnamed protein product [Arabis nemorensis]
MSDSLSLMEEEIIARVHRTRISKEGDAESSSFDGPRSGRQSVETRVQRSLRSADPSLLELDIAVFSLSAVLFGRRVRTPILSACQLQLRADGILRNQD